MKPFVSSIYYFFLWLARRISHSHHRIEFFIWRIAYKRIGVKRHTAAKYKKCEPKCRKARRRWERRRRRSSKREKKKNGWNINKIEERALWVTMMVMHWNACKRHMRIAMARQYYSSGCWEKRIKISHNLIHTCRTNDFQAAGQSTWWLIMHIMFFFCVSSFSMLQRKRTHTHTGATPCRCVCSDGSSSTYSGPVHRPPSQCQNDNFEIFAGRSDRVSLWLVFRFWQR